MCVVMCSWSKLLMVSAFLFFLLTVSVPWVSASSEDVATLTITQAEESFASAFEAVLDAEMAGANVSGLLGRLNLGGEYLAEAYVWYRLGVSENVSRFADLCFEVVGDVRGEAFELRDEAERLGEADFVVKMFGSAVGVIVVVVVGFVVWRVFRRRYRRRVLGLRSEVVSGES